MLKGKYLIEDLLQAGSVNLYRASVDQSPVLVKESLQAADISQQRAGDHSPLVFEAEYELLNSLGPAAFQKVHHHFIEEGSEYLILEWPSGQKLADAVAERAPDENFAVEVAVQLCEAASLIHQRGYVHLDIEPVNIFLDSGRVRLFNFGRMARRGNLRTGYLTTDGYSAPELYTDKKVETDPRADIYSIGAVLYTLLTRKVLPPMGGTFDVLVHDVSEPELGRILLACLALRPEDRCESADEVKRRLLGYRTRPKIPLRFDTTSISDVGMVRRNNEDCGWAADMKGWYESQALSYGLYLVADGMGGEQAGEVASAKAVEVICRTILDTLSGGDTIQNPNYLVIHSIERANKEIYLLARDNPALSSMGTTVTVGLRIENELFLGHVGDSRAYLLRDGEIKQLTEDHSLVANLIRAGLITPEEARNHPDRGKIFRSLGSAPRVLVDLLKEGKLLLKGGDLLLFCTDGLVDYITDDELLAEVCCSDFDPCRRLVKLANARGGQDNVTVITVKVHEI
jgi:protein phosphatase